MKKLFTFMLLLLGVVQSAYAQEPYAVLSNDNTTLTFYYDNDKASRNGMGVGPFTKEINLTTYEFEVNSGWYEQRENITTVVFDDSFANCTSITNTAYWFYDCGKLSIITGMENLNTDNVTDMNSMFYNCSSLTSLDVSNFNTENVTDMVMMFYGCYSLSSLDLSNFNTENVTGMTYMFNNCSGLINLDVSNFNTAKVTNMDSMFGSCARLTSLDVNNFNTAKVTNMCGMFYGCSSLSSLDLNNFNTKDVTDMGKMFYGCSQLTSLDVSNFNTTNVTDMKGMFDGCYSLTSLDLSNFNTVNVTNMKNMFSGCSGLTTIYCNDTWSCSSSANMFKDCSSLVGAISYDSEKTDVTYANPTTGYFTANGSPADGTPMPYAVLSDDNTTLTFYYDNNKEARGGMDVGPFGNEYGIGWYEQRGNITTVVFDDSFANCTSITSTAYWFYDCQNLTTISGIEKLNTANVTDMSYMFYFCISLSSLDVSNFNTANVTNMESMFSDCSSLTSLDVSNFNTANVTNMRAMFNFLISLTSLDVSNFNTAKVTDMSNMFYCLQLKDLNLSNFNTANVTNMGFMFCGCFGLTSLDVSNFNTEKVTVMGSMFDGCSKLTSLDVSSFNTANVTDMSYMFSRCPGLTSLDVSNFNTDKVTDMRTMFDACSKLTSLDVSNFNTANVTNMSFMFSRCSGLTSLGLSNFNTENVTEMDRMFNGCSDLTTIYCNDTWSCSSSTNMFKDCTSLVGAISYDANKTDVTYANPTTGYFTKKTGDDGKVKLSKTEAIIEKGKTLTLKATVTPETLEDKSVTWTSSDTKVATVTSKGKVTAVKTGTATITCTSNATGKKATCKVTVGSVKLDQTEIVVEKTKTKTLTATVYPSTLTDKSVTWTSSDTKIATVSSKGKVKGVKTGTATITCTSNATGLSTTCKVTVGSVKLDQTEIIVEKTKTKTLTATVYPSTLTDKSVTWTSSNTAIATVSSKGKVKGVKTGTATITCTSKATGLSATCEVTVGSVKLDQTEVAVNKGKTVTLTATVYPSTLTDKSVTWTSSNTAIATVSSKGKVKGVKTGTVTITYTSNATGLSATCEVTVGSVKLDQTEVTVKKGKTVTLKATVYPSTLVDKSVTWKSSNKSIATVTTGGKVKGVKAGTAKITCTSNATGLSTTCIVTVTGSASTRSLDGDDDELTGIDEIETSATVEPFDVYDLSGRKVRHQVTSLDGLPNGIYIVNGKKVLKKNNK